MPPSPARKSTSDRASHSFDNSAKAATRALNLRALIEQAHELWDEDSGLVRGDWCELMGESGIKTVELLESAGALRPGGFVGVDYDAGIITRARLRYPRHKWIVGDLLDALARPELGDVCVVNFDGYLAVNSPRIMPIGRLLHGLVNRAVERFGACMLIWNGDLDCVRRLGWTPTSALRAHARVMADLLQRSVGVRRVVRDDLVLPVDAESAVIDPSYTGLLGAVHIYRGKSVGHRMALVRAILR